MVPTLIAKTSLDDLRIEGARAHVKSPVWVVGPSPARANPCRLIALGVRFYDRIRYPAARPATRTSGTVIL
jgi:hypothetical protein